MTVRAYHGTPHPIDSDIVKSICEQGLKFTPAVTINFADAAWHALKNKTKRGTVVVCSINENEKQYSFKRQNNNNKLIMKFNYISVERFTKVVEVEKNEHGQAKIISILGA